MSKQEEFDPAPPSTDQLDALRGLFPMMSDRAFVTYMKDSSMLGVGIAPGALLIIEPHGACENGKTVLAFHQGEHLVRSLYTYRDYRIELRSANDRFETLYVDPLDLRIDGIVTVVVQIS